ncbi:MAG: glycosyl hydrolase-related protein [Anaerolineaceae bacterium]|nr:glycosyl hydrolase-related protein [Anaerolineaceae bacterium]
MDTVHIVSHTHWDREWYQPFQLFRLRLVHLVDNLLAILDKDPEYRHYMLDGQTIVLEDYLQMRLENLPKLQQHIQSNRILIGPWYILPDEFLVSPEATIRNLLIGKEICDFFGQRMMVGYIPDPFGHISQLPQILLGFHIDTACLWRGVKDDTPTCVWWESPDGSRVMLAHLYTSYGNGAAFPATDVEESIMQLNAAVDALRPHNPLNQYLFMRGSDHLEPRPALTSQLPAINSILAPQTEALHSTLPAYLAAATEEIRQKDIELETIKGELRDPKKAHMLPGVLSTRMWIKQRNHRAENLLERWVEPFSTWAALLCDGKQAFSEIPLYQSTPRLANPAPIIHQAWKLLITCHPHDSICGCSIDQVHNEMRPRFDQVEQIGGQLLQQSLTAISEHANTLTPKGVEAISAINVFNASPFEQTGFVTVPIDLPFGVQTIELVDQNGASIPCTFTSPSKQQIEENTYVVSEFVSILSSVSQEGYNDRKLVNASLLPDKEEIEIEAEFSSILSPDQDRLLTAFGAIMQVIGEKPPTDRVRVKLFTSPVSQVSFVAENVPACGLNSYWVKTSSQERVPSSKTESDNETIENEFFLIRVDSVVGALTLTDKRTGAVYKDLNTFLDKGDRGDEYNYCPPEDDTTFSPLIFDIKTSKDALKESFLITYNCPLPPELSSDRTYRSDGLVTCSLTSEITLTRGVPRVDIHTEFDNQVKDHRLEVRFPTGIKTTHATMDGHFDLLERDITPPEIDSSWAELPRPEVSQRAFCDISTDDHGLILANRGLPEVAVLPCEDGTTQISLTLLRCVGWLSRSDMWVRKGHAGPGVVTPDAQEIDHHAFDYSLIPHSGDLKTVIDQAHNFNNPMKALTANLHPGDLLPESAFIEYDNQAFVLSAIKTTEKGDGWLARGYNISSEPIQVTLKTQTAFDHVSEVFLDESHKRTITPESDGSIKLAVGAHEIISIKFDLE